MTTLYFVHPAAARLVMTVDAVNGGKRLEAGKGYRVAEGLVDALLATGDWSRTKPGESAPEPEPVATGGK